MHISYKMCVGLVFCVALIIGVVIGLRYYGHSRSQSVNSAIVQPSTDISLSTSTAFYTIDARYASDTRDTQGAMRAFAEYKVNEKKDEWSATSTAYADAMALAKKYPDMPQPHFEYDLTYVTYQSAALHTISYLYAAYTFTGGANGVTTLASFTFGPQGAIPIDSVLDFNNGNDIALTKLLRTKLIAALGQSADADMIDHGLGLAFLRKDGSFDNKKCGCDGFFFGSNFQNFYVTDQGITFAMNQEAVASHADGMPEVLFTWSELAPFMLKTSPIHG